MTCFDLFSKSRWPCCRSQWSQSSPSWIISKEGEWERRHLRWAKILPNWICFMANTKKKQKNNNCRWGLHKCYCSRNRTTGSGMFFSHCAACVTVNGDSDSELCISDLMIPEMSHYNFNFSQPHDLSSAEWPDTWLSGLSQEKRAFVACWSMRGLALSHHSRLPVTGLTGCMTVDKCGRSGWQYSDLRNNKSNV